MITGVRMNTNKKYLDVALLAVASLATSLASLGCKPPENPTPQSAAVPHSAAVLHSAAVPQSAVVFTPAGELRLPEPATFRRWMFVGSPLTPNGLNNGPAMF